jgi:hypothetical protein
MSSISSVKTSAAVASAWDTGTDYNPNTKANMLAVGNVIAFKTHSGKYGLALITSATGGDASTGKGILKMDVVVQQ